MPIERIHLKCGYDALLSSVAARLEASGYAVSKNSHPATESTISLSSDNGEELESIQASLGPLNTRIIWNPDIGDIVEINLGDGQLLSELNVTVNAGSMVLNAQLKRESNPWGFNEFSTSVKDVDEVSVVFGMCSEFNLGLI